jgi:anaerobic selenocysteine-containing dehydrogenase
MEVDRGMTWDRACKTARAAGEQAVPTFCAMCGPKQGCGIYAFVKDGRFTRVVGMRESPLNRGSVCAKGHAAPQWVYAPERLKVPLKRVGAKGEGKFAPISWDEAISLVADTLKAQKRKYGPETLAILSPAKRSYSNYLRRLLIAHGSPNYGHSGICVVQRLFACTYTLGGYPAADLANSDLVVYWGRQPIFSGPAMGAARMLVAAKARGAMLISIKPSVEPDTGLAHVWVPIRPGTDAALALAMLHVVITEDLIDHDFVAQWCHGFDQLASHILKFTPAWAERICGVPAQQIVDLARQYATTPKAAIDMGNGLEHAPSSSDAIRAIAMLIAVTGHLDRPGANLLSNGLRPKTTDMPNPKGVHLRERYTPEWVEKLVAPEFPKPFQPFAEGTSSAYYRILESVLTQKPYPIRAVISPGTQPLVSTRGSRSVTEALKKLDFYVVADVTRTADMNFADVVFPTATPYETDAPFEAGDGWIMARRKVIEPLGPYKSIYELILDLGVALGYGEDFWHGDMTACQNDQLAPFDMTIDQLREHPVGLTYPKLTPTYENYAAVFKTCSPGFDRRPFLPQGKVALFNTTFEAAGFAALPDWREPAESLTRTPELTDRFPLILSDYHTSKLFTAGWQRNVPLLREMDPDPALHIHPATAAERCIADGDAVVVESPHGWLRVKAQIYPGIRPDTVMLLHGWWQGCQGLGREDVTTLDGGANVNLMYSVDPQKAFDPLITAMSSQTLVQVRRAEN